MTTPHLILTRLVEDPRDRSVAAILEAMARAIDAGAEVEPEPERRDAATRVIRSGPLKLPRRADLSLAEGGRTLFCRVESQLGPPGNAAVVRTAEGFSAEIETFRWEAAEVTLRAAQAELNWTPLRRWFLEWFQSRHTELAPDLLGAVHSIGGPRRVSGGWSLTVDFGSAPVACVTELVQALAQTGAQSMLIGHE
jgi:hypothetical protein